MHDSNFAAEMKKVRAGTVGGPYNRIAVSFRLASNEPVSTNTWVVNHDELEFPGHVTIAVLEENGHPAVEEDGRRFHIPELSNMNWELTTTMYVCAGRADWRDDYFPSSTGWKDVIAAFDLIMRYGGFDEYLDIWRVHSIMHRDVVGLEPSDAIVEVSVPLQLALDTVRSFLFSGECDPNESNTVIHNAIDFLEKVLADSARIAVKPSVKHFMSAPALLTTSKSNKVNLDDCSPAANEILTKECRKFNIIPAFGSTFALSDESTISFPGARAVTVMDGKESLCFTWNGDTFKNCVLDEIGEVESGMIRLRLSYDDVRLKVMTAGELFQTVVDQQTISIAENCQGITLGGVNCCNKTQSFKSRHS